MLAALWWAWAAYAALTNTVDPRISSRSGCSRDSQNRDRASESRYPQTLRMPHPLDGIHVKLARAEELWNELGASLAQFLEGAPYRSEGAFDAETSEWVVRFRLDEEPPLRWGILIGDVVHNLRSALDHLAWQLVLVNGCEPTRRTQFPIYCDEARFSGRGQAQIAGMADEDKATIEELQPFRQRSERERPHELMVLQYLSNVDKHRVVHTTLVQTAGSQFRIFGLEDISGIGQLAPQFGALSDGAELVRIAVVPEGPAPRLSVDAQLEFDVAFADEDSPVYDENVPGVLLELREHVGVLVARFEPRFG